VVSDQPGRPRGFLLDTNVIVAALAEERAVLEKVEGAEGSLFVPATALGELHFGARKSARVEQNLRRIEGFAARAQVLPCDEETARLYGQAKDGLRRRGRPIPENDVWIAAVALQHGLALISRDSHFEYVEGLRLERW
jgi:tRNA(fMet)-specific endonuclease VapC